MSTTPPLRPSLGWCTALKPFRHASFRSKSLLKQVSVMATMSSLDLSVWSFNLSLSCQAPWYIYWSEFCIPLDMASVSCLLFTGTLFVSFRQLISCLRHTANLDPSALSCTVGFNFLFPILLHLSRMSILPFLSQRKRRIICFFGNFLFLFKS